MSSSSMSSSNTSSRAAGGAAAGASAAAADVVVVSLGQNKGSFVCPAIVIAPRPFAHNASCVDLLSFDVGTVHLGVARVRYDRATHQCCILHGALVDIYQPHCATRLDVAFRSARRRARSRKPAHVEPFDGARWPPPPAAAPGIGRNGKLSSFVSPIASNALHRNQDDGNDDDDGDDDTALAASRTKAAPRGAATAFHERLLQEKRALRTAAAAKQAESGKASETACQQYLHAVELMPLALDIIPWLHDRRVDRVLVEQQQQLNSLMRILGYGIFDMFQTRRLLALAHADARIAALRDDAALELFPSTLKLSPFVVNTLLQCWRVTPDAAVAYDTTKMTKQPLASASALLMPEAGDDDADDAEAALHDDDDDDARHPVAEAGVRVRSLEDVERECKRRKTAKVAAAAAVTTHDDLVEHTSHGKKKTSAVRVIAHLFRPAATSVCQHPFNDWLDAQRCEKHNVCDAILQAFAWIVKYEQEPQMRKVRKRRRCGNGDDGDYDDDDDET